MAARPRERRMNVEEALAEIFADRDSDVSDFSDSEFEANVSEESEEEEEENEGEEDESGEANIEDDELENARGPVRGNRGVRGGRVRGRGRGFVPGLRGKSKNACWKQSGHQSIKIHRFHSSQLHQESRFHCQMNPVQVTL